MFTLDTTNTRWIQLKRHIIPYIVAGIVLIILDRIYAQFAHGVPSLAMSTSCMYPLIGALCWGWLSVTQRVRIEGEQMTWLYRYVSAGVSTLAIAAFIQGVFEIAGTDSRYLMGLFIVGWSWIVVAIVKLAIGQKAKIVN